MNYNRFISLSSAHIHILWGKGSIPEEEEVSLVQKSEALELAPRGKLVFGTGILGLLSVPVFKAATGLPPYLGNMSHLFSFKIS
jgi:hypothetical protein